jgi:hypothetical protein
MDDEALRDEIEDLVGEYDGPDGDLETFVMLLSDRFTRPDSGPLDA